MMDPKELIARLLLESLNKAIDAVKDIETPLVSVTALDRKKNVRRFGEAIFALQDIRKELYKCYPDLEESMRLVLEKDPDSIEKIMEAIRDSKTAEDQMDFDRAASYLEKARELVKAAELAHQPEGASKYSFQLTGIREIISESSWRIGDKRNA